MKTYKYVLLLLLGAFVFGFNGNAQNLSDDNTKLINQYFQHKTIAEVEANNKGANLNTNNLGSVVLLKQIGNYNVADIKVGANDSQTVSQIGKNNYYGFINYYNNAVSNFNILQQGEANSLQIYGQNSLINTISILQTGDFKSLIIKNY
jgi:hypothetical protein